MKSSNDFKKEKEQIQRFSVMGIDDLVWFKKLKLDYLETVKLMLKNYMEDKNPQRLLVLKELGRVYKRIKDLYEK